MVLEDVTEFVVDHLTFPPINGKSYKVPPLDALTGLKLQRLMTLAQMVSAGAEVSEKQLAELSEHDDDQPQWLWRQLLGPVHDEMLDDGVPWEFFEKASRAAVAFFSGGSDEAAKVWRVDSGKAPVRRQPRDRQPKKTT